MTGLVAFGPLQATRFKGADGTRLCYQRQGRWWRLVCVEAGGSAHHEGFAYATRAELLADVGRHAEVYGWLS